MNKERESYDLMYSLNNNFLDVNKYKINKNKKEIVYTRENNILVKVISGEKKISIGKDNFYLSAGELLFVKPFTKINSLTLTDVDIILIRFNEKILHKFLNDSKKEKESKNKRYLLIREVKDTVSESFKSILKYLNDENLNQSLINIYSLEFIAEFLKIKEVEDILKVSEDLFVRKAIDLMKRNIFNNLSIEDISKEINMSVANFSARFKNLMGLSPKEYFRILKMKEAKVLIEYKTINEVSDNLGYKNVSYFIKLFKESYGITPKQYLLKRS